MVTKIFVSTLCVALIAIAGNIWIETTQEDFADGCFERDIYSSHCEDGTVKFVPRYDLNNDGYIDLFTADVGGPYIKLFWGSVDGYSPQNATFFPTAGGSNCDAADLNGDGYADFIVTHQFNPRVSIYWGGPEGPTPDNYLDFPSLRTARQGVFIADVNKDGYLEIITTQEFTSGHVSILWGDATGYNITRRTDLPMAWGISNIEVVDLNQDSWYDIVFADYHRDSPGYVHIYWGSNSGFKPSQLTSLIAPKGFHGNTVADLNEDGYYDLVCQGWYDTKSYIYWGSITGYSESNRQTLYPGPCYGGSSVADMNKDGYLDIVYHRGGYGCAQQRIYWGSSTGYSDGNVSYVGIPLEITGGLVADLNFDGHLDLFVNAIRPGQYSYIFYGPSFTEYTSLPVNLDHKAMFREIGNLTDRGYYEDYISSVFDAEGAVDWGVIEWNASLPSGTEVLFWLRSRNATKPDQIHAAPWSDWIQVFNGGAIPEILNARYLQYKTRLAYTNPCYLPMLNEVCITYAPQTVSSGDLSISCSPNPFTNKADITLSSNINSNNSIKVYDISGSLIRTLKITGNNTESSVTWDRKDRLGRLVPAGIYFIKAEDKEGAITKKVVILN